MRGDSITVCICTYKRPELLAHLLMQLQNQKTEELFSYDVVVVDNDRAQTAKPVVENAQTETNMKISYYCEPEQNIALARNRAVKNAKGEYIGFLDDDEYPISEWLLRLYKSIRKYHADGVLGPVKPHFEQQPPMWVIRGRICERDSFPTGTELTNARYTRTGNVLLSKTLFKNESDYFNPGFGRTGGEDVDFFNRMIRKGCKFVWDNEAVAFESVPPDRTTRKYFLTRALLRGVINSKQPSLRSLSKSVFASTLYTAALPFLFLIGHHVFMKYLIKDCDHIGKLLGVCGFKSVKERNF